MVRCPNCGQKTDNDECQWCHYPILKGHPKRSEAKGVQRTDSEIEGYVEIVVPMKGDVDSKKVEQLQGQVLRAGNSKLVWTGWAEREGFTIGLSLQKPVNLTDILMRTTTVKKIKKKDNKFMATLKATNVN